MIMAPRKLSEIANMDWRTQWTTEEKKAYIRGYSEKIDSSNKKEEIVDKEPGFIRKAASLTSALLGFGMAKAVDKVSDIGSSIGNKVASIPTAVKETVNEVVEDATKYQHQNALRKEHERAAKEAAKHDGSNHVHNAV
jgi:hypothetical protein